MTFQRVETVRPTATAPVPGYGPTESFGLTDIGVARTRNEDHFLVANLARSIHIECTSLPAHEIPAWSETHRELLLVADGIGGHAGGEIASRLVAEELLGYVSDAVPVGLPLGAGGFPAVERKIRAAIDHCQAVVDRRAEYEPDMARMGTTVTLAYLMRPYMVVGHVGDSRCYLLRQGELQQLTRDHTVAQEKIDAGALDSAAALRSADSHKLTGAIGGGLLGVTPDVFTIGIESTDVVLLCTDGLTERLDDARIRDILASSWTTEEACRRLVTAAKRAGSMDNITCVVTRFAAPDDLRT